jgi:hypothetical protein
VGDSDSIGALSAAHRHHHPADVLIDATADLSGQARSTLQRRMQRDEPPDTFMGNAGRDFMRWIFVDGVDDAASKLMPLDGLLALLSQLSWPVVSDSAKWRHGLRA